MGKIWHANRFIPKKQTQGLVSFSQIWLSHDKRHVRRKLLTLTNEKAVMLNFHQAVHLADGDILDTEEGEYFLIRAAKELLYKVRGKNEAHLLYLAWHLGNRHLQIEVLENSIVLQRDHVIATIIEGLGATVEEVEGPFQPLCGVETVKKYSHV